MHTKTPADFAVLLAAYRGTDTAELANRIRDTLCGYVEMLHAQVAKSPVARSASVQEAERDEARQQNLELVIARLEQIVATEGEFNENLVNWAKDALPCALALKSLPLPSQEVVKEAATAAMHDAVQFGTGVYLSDNFGNAKHIPHADFVLPPVAAPVSQHKYTSDLLIELRRWAGDDEGYASVLVRSAVKEIERLAASEASASPVPPDADELTFNAQRLRNVAKLVGLESAVPEDDATLDGARGAVLGQIASKLREGAPDIAALVNRFLGWQMPEHLCDALPYMPSYPHRIGTHLMNADQAKAMFEHVLAPVPAPALLAEEPLNFVQALKIANSVFERYKEDQYKWWRKMDGTPILNDVAVRMAEAFMSDDPSPQVPETPVKVGAENNLGEQQ